MMPADPLSTPQRAAVAATPRRRAADGVGVRARTAASLALLALVAACAEGPAATVFDLGAARPAPTRALRGQLRIVEPIASVDLDSDHILVRTGPQRIATLAGAKWSDRLPALVQARLTQTFDNAGLLRHVGRRPSSTADYDLDIDIRAFELDAAQSRVEVDLAVKLVSTATGRVAAAEIFTEEAPVASTSGAEVAAALDGALATVMKKIVAFAATRV